MNLVFEEYIEQPKVKQPSKKKSKRKPLLGFDVSYYARVWRDDGTTDDRLIKQKTFFAKSVRDAVNRCRFSLDMDDGGYMTSQYGIYPAYKSEIEYVWIVKNANTGEILEDTKG